MGPDIRVSFCGAGKWLFRDTFFWSLRVTIPDKIDLIFQLILAGWVTQDTL